MLTPEEIQTHEFLVSLRGYDRDEVHAFLDRVADQVRQLQEGLEKAQKAPAPAAAAEAPAAPSREGAPKNVFAELGRETQRILETAAEAGEELRRQAKQEADRELQAARSQAAKVIADAERRREELQRSVDAMYEGRDQLAGELRAVEGTIQHLLRDLTSDEGKATSMREALAAAATPTRGAEDRTSRRENAEAIKGATAAEAAEGSDTERGTAEAEDEDEDEEAETRAAAAAEPADPSPGQEAGDTTAETEAAAAPAAGEAASTAATTRPRAEDPLALRGAVLSPLHPKVVRAVKRGMQDLQNVVLDRIRRADGKGEPEDFVPSDSELSSLTGAVTPMLDEAYRAGKDAGVRLAGLTTVEVDADRNFAEAFQADAARHTRSGLTASLRIGLEAGGKGGRDPGLRSLTDRVGSVFSELKSSAAEELAATHLIGAYELGHLDAWAAAGIAQRRWVLGKEPRCPEARCRLNDQAGPLQLDEEFPSGHQTPPVHVGCNCTTAPVVR